MTKITSISKVYVIIGNKGSGSGFNVFPEDFYIPEEFYLTRNGAQEECDRLNEESQSQLEDEDENPDGDLFDEDIMTYDVYELTLKK